jgi:Bor protein
MSRTVNLIAATALLGLGACYHATIDTGLAPGPQVIDQPWASGWVYGLVPPKTVETMSKCKSGVSKVETLHSFLNSLVGGLTFGIYTPITIKVTCAAGGRASIPAAAPQIELGAYPTLESAQDALNRAAALALQTDLPVYIQH